VRGTVYPDSVSGVQAIPDRHAGGVRRVQEGRCDQGGPDYLLSFVKAKAIGERL